MLPDARALHWGENGSAAASADASSCSAHSSCEATGEDRQARRTEARRGFLTHEWVHLRLLANNSVCSDFLHVSADADDSLRSTLSSGIISSDKILPRGVFTAEMKGDYFLHLLHQMDDKVVMTGYDLIASGATRVWRCGTFLCIRLPLRTLTLCWRTQIFFLCLPYRCLSHMVRMLRFRLEQMLHRPACRCAMDLLQCIVGNEMMSSKGMLYGIQEIRRHSLLAVTRMNVFNKELGKCRKQLVDWKLHTSMKTKELSTIANEERRLLRVIVGALKHLRWLKGNREIVDEKIKNNLEELIVFSKTLATKEEQLNDSNILSSPGEMNAALKMGYKKLQRQAEQLKEIIEMRRNVIGHGEKSLNCNSTFDGSGRRSRGVREPDVVAMSMDALQTIVALLSNENTELKKRLTIAHKELADVKNTCDELVEQVAGLENQLAEVQGMLREVQGERDEMRQRLMTLQCMIEEEEVFLNYDQTKEVRRKEAVEEETYYDSQEYNFEECLRLSRAELSDVEISLENGTTDTLEGYSRLDT